MSCLIGVFSFNVIIESKTSTCNLKEKKLLVDVKMLNPGTDLTRESPRGRSLLLVDQLKASDQKLLIFSLLDTTGEEGSRSSETLLLGKFPYTNIIRPTLDCLFVEHVLKLE